MQENQFAKYGYQEDKKISSHKAEPPKLTNRKSPFFSSSSSSTSQLRNRNGHKRKKKKLNIKPSNRRKDLTQNQRNEVFYLFHPEARDATGYSSGYLCPVCKNSFMYINITNSWNAAHIKPIEHCPVRDPKYVLPTCTTCNGLCGVNKKNHINMFDMMILRGYQHNIFSICKTLYKRYNTAYSTIIEFIYHTYGRPSSNQNGEKDDDNYIISNPNVYQIIFSEERVLLEQEHQIRLEKKGEESVMIENQIIQAVKELGVKRREEAQLLYQMLQEVKEYETKASSIFI